ncbi:MAG: galactokinase [Verrucomicrobia bacterium]|nr:galactokinase [Verrucomicrobiota bacterium]
MSETTTTFAPGRVEILGNHTDYNLGFVLSAAIHLGVTIEASRLSEEILEISSETNQRSISIELSNLRPLTEDAWANYPVGVIKVLLASGFRLSGMRLNISSDLPLGAGLSSSAALEVATALAAKALFDLEFEKMRLAQLCQKAENEFVGVQSGLLDQASSVFGKSHQLILLDFLNVTVETVSLPANASLLLLNSGVPHQLTGGEYNERRKQCMLAAKSLGIKSLRDATLAQLESVPLDEVTRRRAIHVVGESDRVLQGVQALRSNRLQAFGDLMFASHVSSQINFENSTSYLDVLVDLARKTPGVFGSRLTGGGFGGSTVSLIQAGYANEIVRTISLEYHKMTGANCSAILTEPSEGARILS